MATKTVTMSRLFKWYGGDFSPDAKERLGKLAAFLTAVKRQQLTALSQEAGKVSIKYKEFDWSPNCR